jgi:hypothetical protein
MSLVKIMTINPPISGEGSVAAGYKMSRVSFGRVSGLIRPEHIKLSRLRGRIVTIL